MSARSRLRVILTAQAVFMVGFSSVVPFLAVLAGDRFALGPAAIGAIVGARVAVQQGLFIVGGALADRFGPRTLLLAGCAVRACGFVLLALAPSPALFVVAVLLIGVAGALFSPAVDAYIGTQDAAAREVAAARRDAAASARRRGPTPFAALALAGEAGGIVGAVIGAVLLPGHAVAVVLGAALLFVVALAALIRLLPARMPRVAAPGIATSSAVQAAVRTRGRGTLLSAAGAATVLAVYTQLFSLLPLGMSARGIGGGWVGAVSILLSLTILVLQWPLSRLAERLSRPVAVVLGLAAALLAVVAGAVSAAVPASAGFALAAAAATIGTAIAVMLAMPSAQSLVAEGSPARRATRLGALASAGGLLALGASSLAGAVAGSHGLVAAWLVAALAPAAGLVFACIGARTPAFHPHPRKDHHDHPDHPDHSPTIPEDRRRRANRAPAPRPRRLLLRRPRLRRGVR